MRGINYLIILLLVGLLLVTACDMIPGNPNRGCSVGDACTYYTGSEGVVMYPERNPRMMYYRTQDRNEEDGNEVILSMRLENRGASDSYGALFLSGFAPGITDMFIQEQNGNERKIEPTGISNCYFDINPNGLGLNTENFLGNIFGAFSCNGLAGSSSKGGWRLRGDGSQIAEAFGWTNAPAIIKALDFDVSGSGGIDNFKIGYNSSYFDVFVNGKKLAALLYNLDFEGWGGDVFELKGDNPDSPGGDIDVKTFVIKMSGEWPAGQDYFDIPYQWKTCYGYTTFISPLVCIDPDPISDENKLCRADDIVNMGGSQGAPIAVTRLEQTNTGKGLLLDFTVQNVGRGRVWDIGYLEACSPYFSGSVRSTMYDKVYIGPSLIGNDYLDCTPREIRLDPNTGEGRFTCRYDFNGVNGYDIGSAYTTPLRIELWYGYEETMKDQLTVRRVS